MYVCMYVLCTYICMCVCMHMCLCTYVYMYVSICVYVRTNVCMCVCICVYKNKYKINLLFRYLSKKFQNSSLEYAQIIISSRCLRYKRGVPLIDDFSNKCPH